MKIFTELNREYILIANGVMEYIQIDKKSIIHVYKWYMRSGSIYSYE